MDEEFYKIHGIDHNKFSVLNIVDDITRGGKIQGGKYYTGKSGGQPDWHTIGDFRWELTLADLDDVVRYIEYSNEEPDAVIKSNFIFKYLQKNVEKLEGTVYIGGSTPNLVNEHAEIVKRLSNKKWLFAESGELVASSEISKGELNSSFYGSVIPDSKLYDILGFRRSKVDELEEVVKDYDKLTEDIKQHYFEIELKRRYGLTVTDLDKNYGEDFSNLSEKTDDRDVSLYYEFPTANIRNWESLRKHAAEVLSYACPVEYQYKLRRIRTSKPINEVRAYLMNMYKVDGEHKYACQMCHKVYTNIEACQIVKKPKMELDPLNLCLCPNCAMKYRKVRDEWFFHEEFLDKIRDLKELDISRANPVKINLKVGFESTELWFTQIHVAEIRELYDLMYKADTVKLNKEDEKQVDALKSIDNQNNNSEPVKENKDDRYASYVGKRVKHKSEGEGIVQLCNEQYIAIRFTRGRRSGETVGYDSKICFSNNLIEVLE